MKRIANYLIVLALAVFAFTSCEDVPSPFGQIVAPKTDDGEVIEPSGSGTQADPYNVAGVIEYLSGLGADVPSPSDVYIKGIVTEITEAFGTQYGNATFKISDTENASNSFLCYRVKYLGNTSYSDPSALNIKEGNTVVICGKVVNYKGNTPETSANAAYVYSINGQGGSGGGGGTPAEEVKKVTVAEFNAAAESATQYYQLTGTVKNLKDGDQYGNFDLEDATGSVYVYGLLAEKGGESKKFQELAAAKGIKNGVTLTINGLRSSYNDKVQVKSAYFVSVEAGSGGGGGGTGATGSGTQADPYNAAGANAYISSLAADTESPNDIYIKGKFVKYANKGEFSTQYGNASFYLSDDGSEGSEQFYVFRTLYLGNVKYESGETPKANDEIVICGKVVNYKGNTPETVANKSYIYSLNGNTSAGGGGGGGESGAASGDGSQSNPYNVAAITEICKKLGDKETSDKDYYIKGKICSVKYSFSAQYGTATFNISDDGKTGGTEFTAYSVYYYNMTAWVDGNTQVAVGDDVILFGKITNYGGTLETASKKACIYSLNGKTSDSGSGGSGSGGSGSGGGSAATSLTNGDFETWADGLPTGWKSASTASSATLTQSTDAHGGKYSCNVNGDESQNKRLASQEITLAAGTYVFSAWIKATTSDVAQARPGYVPIGADGKAGSYAYGDYANLTTNWQQFSCEFTLDSEKTICLVIMNPKKSSYSSGKDILVDDATLTKK